MNALFPDFYNTPKTDRRTAVGQGREKRSWQVTDVWDRHHDMKRRIFLGQDNVTIAKALNCTTQSVSQVRNSEVIKKQLQAMQGLADEEAINIRAEIHKLAPEAVRVLGEVISGEIAAPAQVRLAAAKDILDRDGHGAVQKTQTLHGHFTASDLDEIKKRARATCLETGTLVTEESQTSSPDPNLIELES